MIRLLEENHEFNLVSAKCKLKLRNQLLHRDRNQQNEIRLSSDSVEVNSVLGLIIIIKLFINSLFKLYWYDSDVSQKCESICQLWPAGITPDIITARVVIFGYL